MSGRHNLNNVPEAREPKGAVLMKPREKVEIAMHEAEQLATPGSGAGHRHRLVPARWQVLLEEHRWKKIAALL